MLALCAGIGTGITAWANNSQGFYGGCCWWAKAVNQSKGITLRNGHFANFCGGQLAVDQLGILP